MSEFGSNPYEGRTDSFEEAGSEPGGGVDALTERVGDLAQSLLESPVVGQALGAAFGARNRAAGAQRVAMHAMDIPSRSELERTDRRLRTLADRLDAVEDELDRLAADVRFLRENTGSGG